MSKVKYTDAPADVEESLDYLLEHPSSIEDTLPPPEYFAEMLVKEKISLNVDRHTLRSFRNYAKKHGLKYQALMNQVLSSYAKKIQAE
ncbi:hypothetical protein FWH58_01765 [Candidatus Saccharibacteria bacterium]|nr:hypothetical protein [Candidatus Saccharibacteria bacterium]